MYHFLYSGLKLHILIYTQIFEVFKASSHFRFKSEFLGQVQTTLDLRLVLRENTSPESLDPEGNTTLPLLHTV